MKSPGVEGPGVDAVLRRRAQTWGPDTAVSEPVAVGSGAHKERRWAGAGGRGNFGANRAK